MAIKPHEDLPKTKELTFDVYYKRIKRIKNIPDVYDNLLMPRYRAVFDSLNALCAEMMYADKVTECFLNPQGKARIINAN